MADTGNLYVIAAPSGAGKTTLVKALIESIPKLTVSISHTTRPKRTNEVDGVNYYFIDSAAFHHMIEHADFLEYATIFDHLYGTSKTWVEETLAKGIDVILEIDWQGHLQIKKLFPASIGIFILPPSLNDLQDRLKKRNQDRPQVIKKRIANVHETVSHIYEFEYVVMNDDFIRALNDLTMIIEAGRLTKRRQVAKFEKLISNFLDNP